jgi:hypothetical protein
LPNGRTSASNSHFRLAQVNSSWNAFGKLA